MFRLAGMGIFGVAAFVLWIYCVFDVIASDEVLIRNLPKFMWLMVVLFLPTVGGIAWLALGRPLYAGWRPGDTSGRGAARQPLGVEDRADFARPARAPDDARRLQDWEADLQRREEELKRRRRDENER